MPTPCPHCHTQPGHPHHDGCPELARIRREQDRAARLFGLPTKASR